MDIYSNGLVRLLLDCPLWTIPRSHLTFARASHDARFVLNNPTNTNLKGRFKKITSFERVLGLEQLLYLVTRVI